MAITPTEVARWLDVPLPPQGDALEVLQLVCDAVESHYVDAYRPDPEPPLGERAKHTTLGLTMMAARLWKRQATPEGIGGSAELGPIYITRFDPDIDRMLHPQTGVA